ncbi:AAA family ATPase [Cellulomonas biazotea]|uniref:AAA family ATPase n=1 Tax=Cellulomonas biazotea TaxID=1709 RepID=UPI0013EF361A|nr:AAA family ATPase [Cellulomonas biazotea]
MTDGRVDEIGGVKIGDKADSSRPDLPPEFSKLPDLYFSLGQDEDYYDRLNTLGPDEAARVLNGLNDIALDLKRFHQVESLDVTQTSLLRWVTAVAVQTQLHRIALGGARLSPYSFWYETPGSDRYGAAVQPKRLDFEVEPTSMPRTNIHVLIGRNGVGKSFILNDLATALTRRESAGSVGFVQRNDDKLANRFANVVSVAFSAFDGFERRRQSTAAGALRHHYIGLKNIPTAVGDKSLGLKDHVTLARDFSQSLGKLEKGGRIERWNRILGPLLSDPLFAELLERLREAQGDELRERARRVFAELSSGHKIVLLTLTRLVETVEEASLVLIDEPESHLHPPLLSAFMSALSELLEERNGVAIVATHSPVVLQEVSRSCVWKLMGSAGELAVRRPAIETYGENVGTLTQEVFGLEVTEAGFHRSLAELVREYPTADYGRLVEMFDGRLGAEARALLQSMVYFARQ